MNNLFVCYKAIERIEIDFVIQPKIKTIEKGCLFVLAMYSGSGRYLSRYFEIGNVSYLIVFNTSLFICKIHFLSYPRVVLGILRTYLSIVTFVVISDSMQYSSKRRACLFHRIEFQEIYGNLFQNTVQIF